MAIEDELRERLRKVEALFFGATTAGEREAAGAAAERLKAKLAEASHLDPPVEMKFTMPDQWSARLFIALCRRYGFRPFRYARQRSTTIMVKAPRRLFDAVVWRQFSDAHSDLWSHFEKTTERLIREAIHTDTADAEFAPEPVGLRQAPRFRRPFSPAPPPASSSRPKLMQAVVGRAAGDHPLQHVDEIGRIPTSAAAFPGVFGL